MAVESDAGTWRNYIFGKKHRIFLLILIAVMLVILLLWNTSFASPAHTELSQSQLNTLEQQLTVKLEALPPIPVKIILQQIGYNETEKIEKIEKTAKKENRNSWIDNWNYNWDFRHWKDPKEMEGVPSRTLYLVRHAQYNRTTGFLTELGHKQSEITAQRLKALGRPFSRINYSTHDRTTETAKHVEKAFPGIPSTGDDFLREGAPVPPSPNLSFWSYPEKDYIADHPRMEAAFRKYFFRADKSQKFQSFDIIVAHANVIRYLVLRALQFDEAAWMRLGVPHASITSVTVNPDSFVLVSMLGDCGHMPPDMVTY